MSQQAIRLYIPRKGLGAIVIDQDLVATLGVEAVSYRAVTSDLRQVTFSPSIRITPLLEPVPRTMIPTTLSSSRLLKNRSPRFQSSADSLTDQEAQSSGV
jgi:hypothetical protein